MINNAILLLIVVFLFYAFNQSANGNSLGYNQISNYNMSENKSNLNMESDYFLKNKNESKYNNITTLYSPSSELHVVNENIVLDGYVDVPHGIPLSSIRLYESNENKTICLIDQREIRDLISTYYRFNFTIDASLIKCDEDFTRDGQLEFISKFGNFYSNIIKIKVFSSEGELPIPRLQFIPEKYNLPTKLVITFSSNGVNLSAVLCILGLLSSG